MLNQKAKFFLSVIAFLGIELGHCDWALSAPCRKSENAVAKEAYVTVKPAAVYAKVFPLIEGSSVLPPLNGVYCPAGGPAYSRSLPVNAWTENDQAEISRLAKVSLEMAFICGQQNLIKPHGTKADADDGYAESKAKNGSLPTVRIFLPSKGWEDSLMSLKFQLKPQGFDAFAGQEVEELRIFSKKDEAEAFDGGRSAAGAQLREEGPAEIILDKRANVVSLKGTVEKKDYPQDYKEKVAPFFNFIRFVQQVANWLGFKHPILDFKPEDVPGPKFQFKGYAINQLPPQAKYEYPTKESFKISIPKRWAVYYKTRSAFVVKGIDQFKYLDDIGLPQSVSPSCDLKSVLKDWDRRYGINILTADFSSVLLKLNKQPQDISRLESEIRSMNSLNDCSSPDDRSRLKEEGFVWLWWE